MDYGIKETKETIKWGIQLGMAIEKSLADGEFTWTDASNFMGFLMASPNAIAGIGNVPKELGDLDAAEKEEIKEFIKLEFDIADDKLELAIEKGLGLALELYGMVQLFLKKDEEEKPVEA